MNVNDRKKYISEAHGNGGKLTHELIETVFMKAFSNSVLAEGLDAGRIGGAPLDAVRNGARLAMTTDSFVVKPLFFEGGDIGKLAVTGTLNDLVVSGARPAAITAGFIIEEGFETETLYAIARSMADTAAANGVYIASGDTKVVGRGQCDGVYINTTGIGTIDAGVDLAPENIRPGDAVIITGTPGNHGACILNARGNFIDARSVPSDCAPLVRPLSGLFDGRFGVRVMRDPTRGGVATTLNEFAAKNGNIGIMLEEERIAYDHNARALADILGIDLLYSACEGRALIVCDPSSAEAVLEHLRGSSETRGAAVIGFASEKNRGRVVIKTSIGGGRFLDMQVLEQFPRIC